jgi:hypothetical protein
MTNQGKYFAINSSLCEYDHKSETENAQPEIGTNGASGTWRNPLGDGYGSGFSLPCVSGFTI